MAGIKPAFVTGATAKIKAGNITMAYAQDVSYNVTVTTIPIETMGRYEVVTNEPVAYFVDGTLSVIRYTEAARNMDKVNPTGEGNGIGKWNLNGNDGEGSKGVNPGSLIASETWDLEIFQKTDEGDVPAVVRLFDCRFTRKGGAINKRGVLVEQYAFNAILADDDSFDASRSGDTDLVLSLIHI